MPPLPSWIVSPCTAIAYPALFMTFLENPQKPYPEINLAICLKNSLFFEMFSQSAFQRLVNNPGYFGHSEIFSGLGIGLS
jgi:hypothetical protein